MKNIKILPKLKKKLNWFLTDESGKITKKDALLLSTWALLFSWIDNVFAGHSNNWTPYKPENSTVTVINSAYCNHSSWVVNWHYSATPNVNYNSTLYTHSSHSSSWSWSGGPW